MNKLEDIKASDTVEFSVRGVVSHVWDDGDISVEFEGGCGPTILSASEVASPSFLIKKIEPPLRVGDRVRYASNAMSTTGVVLAFDGPMSVIRFEPPSHSQTYYDAVPTDQMVRA